MPVCLWAGDVLSAAADPESLTFERDIRPILKEHCFHCHGEAGKKKGELDLRLRHLMAAGGESGPAIVPGKVAESFLIERIVSGEMPPGDEVEKLTTEEIEILQQWVAAGAKTARPEPEKAPAGFFITEEEREFWSFQPIERPPVPEVEEEDRVKTPIDAFLLIRLEEQEESFAAEVDRHTFLRRASFDLLGLPPSDEEVEQFLNDREPGAHARLIDRLLESQHYGERWGRHWLDVAGYADSDGAAGDNERPYAYRYRDYVIRSLNADKPFDQFIREQLAGDEMASPIEGEPTPEQAELLIATGFLQMAPDTIASAEDPIAAHDQLVADSLEIVSSSLLGLTVGCARCHDHRYDPISQEDYYRFRAIFEPAFSRPNWREQNRKVEWMTDEDEADSERYYELRRKALVRSVLEKQIEKVPEANRDAARAAVKTEEGERTGEQKKLIADHELDVTLENVTERDRSAKQELTKLENQQKAMRQRIGFLQSIREKGGRSLTTVFLRGDPQNRGPVVSPGELAILNERGKVEIPENDPAKPSSGRRLAYAEHLTNGEHPLLARVIVNRVWMHHFGQGLTMTPTDFGLEGDLPSHPGLLDWLAREFMDNGWSLKHLHRVIMNSSAYRQGVSQSETLIKADPHNRLLGSFQLRRLEAEVLRDAILAVSGDLNPRQFGQPVPVTADAAGEIVVGMESDQAGSSTPVALFEEEHRRSVYIQTRRTTPLTFMEMFDAPVMEPNCEARVTSTAAPQSLVLMNSPFVLRQSKSFANRLRNEAGEKLEDQIRRAWELAFTRTPSEEELGDALTFIQKQTSHFRESPPEPVEEVEVPGDRAQQAAPPALEVLVNEAAQMDAETLALALFCQMLLSSNEFLYAG